MNSTGRMSCLRRISTSFFTVSWNACCNCGWMGHWLQSIITTVSYWRPAGLNLISFSPTKE
jgi:hypothetical protein